MSNNDSDEQLPDSVRGMIDESDSDSLGARAATRSDGAGRPRSPNGGDNGADVDEVVAWHCPHCDYSDDEERFVRQHITRSADERHKDRNGFSPDEYVIAYDINGTECTPRYGSPSMLSELPDRAVTTEIVPDEVGETETAKAVAIAAMLNPHDDTEEIAASASENVDGDVTEADVERVVDNIRGTEQMKEEMEEKAEDLERSFGALGERNQGLVDTLAIFNFGDCGEYEDTDLADVFDYTASNVSRVRRTYPNLIDHRTDVLNDDLSKSTVNPDNVLLWEQRYDTIKLPDAVRTRLRAAAASDAVGAVPGAADTDSSIGEQAVGESAATETANGGTATDFATADVSPARGDKLRDAAKRYHGITADSGIDDPSPAKADDREPNAPHDTNPSVTVDVEADIDEETQTLLETGAWREAYEQVHETVRTLAEAKSYEEGASGVESLLGGETGDSEALAMLKAILEAFDRADPETETDDGDDGSGGGGVL